MTQAELFGAPALARIDGLVYMEDFLDEEEEARLLDVIESLTLREARYKAYTARRRIASYGTQYDFDDNRLLAAASLPVTLEPLRDKAAAWLGVRPERFRNVLVAEYAPGTPLGWHRDVPQFEAIIGVSLRSGCRMRLRPWPPPQDARARRDQILTLELAPRSAYILSGPARWAWQHSISPTPALRYSITFRTAR